MGCTVTDLQAADKVSLVPCRCQLLLKIHDLLNLRQKPAVSLRQVEDFFDGQAGAEGMPDEEDAFGVGHAQLAADDIAGEDVAVAIGFRADAPGFAVAAQGPLRVLGARPPCLQRAQAFLQAFLERPTDGQRFAHAFHLRGERGVGLRRFLEGKYVWTRFGDANQGRLD